MDEEKAFSHSLWESEALGAQMSARNPFQGHEGYDTVHNVVCGLEYLSQCFDQASQTTMLEDLAFGQFLILQTLAEALRGAKAQFERERERANAQTSSADQGDES